MRRISSDAAREILLKANENRVLLENRTGDLIGRVLTGSQKTYKYILVTGLLAKSTDGMADALSLQAGDNSAGAYDARSLCHKVVVPFEREHYQNVLGGSNEPFLNKPARFPRLAETNAARAGAGGKAKNTCFEILSSVKTSEDAFRCLCSAVYVMSEVSYAERNRYKLPDVDIARADLPQTVLDYITELASRSFGGETCPLIVAALEDLYYGKKYKIVPHKVNESGTSSRETGDIDVFSPSGGLLSSIEVKDKDFTKEDVDHAIHKFAAAGLEKSLFVFGNRASFDRGQVFAVAAKLGGQGCFCPVVSVGEYAKMRLYSIRGKFSVYDFINLLLEYAEKTNAGKRTVRWIKDCALEFSL